MTRLYDIKDVMSRYGVTYHTVYRWRKNELFPESVGVGKLLWTEAQLVEWENRKSVQMRAPPTTAAQKRRATKDFRERQEAANATLQRHESNRNNTNKERNK